MIWKSYLLIILVLISSGLAAKILCVFTIPSYSHQITYRALSRELGNRGHELLIITTDPDQNTTGNVKQIDVGQMAYKIVRDEFLAKLKPDEYDVSYMINKALQLMTEEQIKIPAVKKIIVNKENQKFDLIILEVIDRGSFIFTNVFDAPVVGISSLTLYDFTYEAMGAPVHPLLYENLWDSHLNDGSLVNKFMRIITFLRRQVEDYLLTVGYNSIFKRHLGESAKTLPELVDKLDLVLANANPVWHGPRPLPPGIVYVGGLHLRPQKPLPTDIKQLLDKSNNGIIYMSLGGNVQSKDLPPETLAAFMQVFQELPYTVIWKWEGEEMKDKSDNIHTMKWLPQSDMLGHPNIKLFISQGGLQSTDEAIRGHVPIIGIPFLGDQSINADKFEHFKIGKRLDLKQINKETLKATILEVITNDSYRKNIERLHKLISDGQVEPTQNAAWWCEYILRHGTGKHLRSPKLPLYQFYMLDLLAILLGGIYIIWVAATLMIRFAVCSLRSKKVKKN